MSFDAVLRRHAAAQPEKTAVVDDRARLTYAELDRLVDRVAGGLAGARHPARATSSRACSRTAPRPSSSSTPSQRLGAVWNPIVPIYGAREIRFILRQADSAAVVVPDRFRGVDYPDLIEQLRPDVPSLREVLVVDEVAALPHGGRRARGAARAAARRPSSCTRPAPPPIRRACCTARTRCSPSARRRSTTSRLARRRRVRHAVAGEPHLRAALRDPAARRPRRHQRPHGGVGPGALLRARRARGRHVLGRRDAVPAGRHGPPAPRALRSSLAPALSLRRRRRAAGADPARDAPPRRALGARLRLDRVPEHHQLGGTGRAGARSGPRPTGRRSARTRSSCATPMGVPCARGREGEIWARGPELFLGYRDAALNAEAFDERRFFRTGDLGVRRRRRLPHHHRAREGHHRPRRREVQRQGGRGPALRASRRCAASPSCRCPTRGSASASARSSSRPTRTIRRRCLSWCAFSRPTSYRAASCPSGSRS